jgi:hypothetical protein
LDQIQAEGIADQIDKAPWFDPERSGDLPTGRQGYARRFKDAVAATPGLIVELDSLIQAMSEAQSGERTGLAEEIAELVPMSGHPTGFFMARLIRAELGDARLLEEIGNPFAFCRVYHEAAQRSKSDVPTFSEMGLAYLVGLEAQCTGSPDPHR